MSVEHARSAFWNVEIDSLVAQADRIARESPLQAIRLFGQATDLAIAQKDHAAAANALVGITRCYLNLHQMDSAKVYLLKGISFQEKTGDKGKLAKLYNNLGVLCKDLGNYQEALNHYGTALKLSESLADTLITADVYNNFGVTLRRMGNPEEAAIYFIEALKLRELIKDFRGAAIVNGNLGNLYKDQQNPEKALFYYRNSMLSADRAGMKDMVAINLNNIGLIYLNEGKDSLALQTYLEATAYFQNLNLKSYEGSAYQNIGLIYSRDERFSDAIDNYIQALRIFQEINNKAAVAELYNNIGALYKRAGLLDQASTNLFKALEVAQEIGNKQIEMDSYENLYQYYEGKQDFTQAYAYLKRYNTLKDSIYSLSNIKQIAEIEAKYAVEKKEQENEILRKSEEIQRASIARKDIINGFLAFFVLLFAVFIVYYYYTDRNRRLTNTLLQEQNMAIRQQGEEIVKINTDLQQSQYELHLANQQLQQLNTELEQKVLERTADWQQANAELDSFLYHSSHALRRPLTQILGVFNLIKFIQDPNEIAYIYQKLEHTTLSMDAMLRKLVMASEINVADLQYLDISLEGFVNQIWENLMQNHHDLTDMQLVQELGQTTRLITDQAMLGYILENLLENSLFYHAPRELRTPQIILRYRQTGEFLYFEIWDNGIGIKEESLPNLFNMFTVANPSPKGNGLGLYVAKKAVKKLQGEIDVVSKHGEFTKVIVKIPLIRY